MKAMKDILSIIKSKAKTKSRKAQQILSRTFAQMRGRRGAAAASAGQRSQRSKGGDQR